MPFCRFADDTALYDVTPIENMFLLEYLPTAPEDFLRVYLYVRMLSLHPELGDGIESVAEALHMEPDAVQNAMAYWERQGLVRRLTDRPPTYSITPLRTGAARGSDMDSDYYEYRDFNAALQALFGADKLLNPKQYALAYDWVSLLGFTQEAVRKMVEWQIRKAKKPDPTRIFNKLNEIAAAWSERGIRTAEDVERAMAYDTQVEKAASAVLKQFSIRRNPTVDELKLTDRWLHEMALSEAEIIEACAETTKSRQPSFAYLNSILEGKRRGDGESFLGAKAVLQELGGGDLAPTPEQVRSYSAMLASGFEPETVRLAAVQCNRKKKRRFEELEWMVGKWAEMKLFRAADAERYIREMSDRTQRVRALLEKCGSDRRPQMDDLAQYEKWRAEWSEELLHYAAECARGTQMPMRYIDKLLGEWRAGNVKSLEDAKAQHVAHSVSAAHAASASGNPNPALNYAQREYTDEDFASLFIDLDSDGGIV